MVHSINDSSDNKISEKVLRNSFEAVWDKMEVNIRDIIKRHSKESKEANKEANRETNDILEEVLQLLRKQDAVLNNPQKLFPEDYFSYLYRRADVDNKILDKEKITDFFEQITHDMFKMAHVQEIEGWAEILIFIVNFIRENRQILGVNDIPNKVFFEILKELQNFIDEGRIG